MMTSVESLEWRQARQWLITSEVIPFTHKVTKPEIDLVDFARSLRDGVFLCSLLRTLKPGSVPDTDWTPKPLMQFVGITDNLDIPLDNLGQHGLPLFGLSDKTISLEVQSFYLGTSKGSSLSLHHYLRNIAAFLQACRTKFGISDQDLFSDSDLYDVDNFQKVMHVLSLLSHTPEALSLGWEPFPRSETRNYYNQENTSDVSDVYASLKDIGMGMERLYANVDEMYSQVPPDEGDPYGYGDETIYDSICYYQRPPVVTSDNDEKKSNILRELYETEKSFLNVLELISQDFYAALCDHISSEDNELLFSSAKLLYPVHCALLEGFGKCVDPSSKSDITKYFLEAEKGLLNYGQYAARLPMAIERVKQLGTKNETCRILQTCQEQSRQRFPLSDLLSVPVQRFLKYPLLTKELLKCAKKAVPIQAEVKQLEKVVALVEDIARYINSSKGDYENMRQIEEVEQSLVDYRGLPLLQCGRYILDGELRIRSSDQASVRPSPKWAFLFDKVMLLCKKVTRLGFDVRYSPKHVFTVSTLSVSHVPQTSTKPTKFSYAFRLNVRGQGEYIACAKTDELKSQWIEAINNAKDMSSPPDGKKSNHSFELHTFDQPSHCDVCQKLLHGCYFQGYFCPACKRASHRECLKDVDRCSAATSAPSRPMLRPTLSSGGRLTRIATEVDSKKGQIYVAKQKYDAIGNRSTRVLSFEKGEELEVLTPNPNSEWWEAISLVTGNVGEVPASFLLKKGSVESVVDLGEDRLRGYPWYLGKKSRIDAEQALFRMQDGVFLIRESDVRPGEYAIALKWKRMPKHIKVSKHTDTQKFYVSDVCEFLSVEELVAYYQHNSLGSSFPGVDTTLRYPYRDMIDGTPRSRSTSTTPAPPLPNPRNGGRTASPIDSNSLHQVDRIADVMFPFIAEYPDELTIERNDRIRIVDTDTNRLGWWLGECNGKTGLFPSNYVREITN